MKETQKRLWVDCMIVEATGRVPNYQMPQIQSATQIMGNLTKEQIEQNKNELLKRLIELQENYEKGTVQMLEQLKDVAKEAGHGVSQFLAKAIDAVKKELEDIEFNKQTLEKTGYDIEKLKGDKKMYPHEHEHEHEMRRRHHMEREHLDRQHDHEHEMRRRRHHYGAYPTQHEWHESEHPMGYRRRHHGEYPMPYVPYMDYDHEDAEMRRRRHR